MGKITKLLSPPFHSSGSGSLKDGNTHGTAKSRRGLSSEEEVEEEKKLVFG